MAVPRTRFWLPFFVRWVLLAVGCTAFPESSGSSANGSVMTVDAKGRELYQRIVVALKEAIGIMAEIDAIIEAHGGWPHVFQTGSKVKAANADSR